MQYLALHPQNTCEVSPSLSWRCLRTLVYGLLLPFGFAPFHHPGLTIIGLAFFYSFLIREQTGNGFMEGLFFGLGFFGLGTSWVYISIQQYGQLNFFLSILITLSFTLYLSLFPATLGWLFKKKRIEKPGISSGLFFSGLWVLSEYARATLFGGFPWLLVGFGQFDAPVKYLLPVIGIYGGSFLTALAATLLANWALNNSRQGLKSLLAFVVLLLLPLICQSWQWGKTQTEPISIGIIQANLSMRDKWDERLFWHLFDYYEKRIYRLLGTQVIVMPESAIPIPTAYIRDILDDLSEKAKKAGSSILLGIPEPTAVHTENYFNALTTLGNAKGTYLKQHLVPFGEYIPAILQPVMNWLNIPDTNLQPGNNKQKLIQVQHHPVATLICYELAYGDLLRKQLPSSEWIVSISDDGWFGHSLAMYQQLQIAQVRSLQTARYQIVANNDGLSAVIDTQGNIKASLPAYKAGVLQASILPATGSTPWLIWGEWPALLFSIFSVFGGFLKVFTRKTIADAANRGYP